jgi:excisionase family DNA binding protein
MRDLKNLSTGQLAKFCGVDHRTVLRWIQQGYLKSFQLPGRGDNRIPRAECLRFMQEHGIPIPEELKQGQVEVGVALVVEDDKDMAQLTKIMLTKQGFQVTLADDGFKAGTLLHTLKPSLLVLDLNIPMMDGFEVMEHIRRNDDLNDVAVLVVSGLPQAELNRAEKAGANAVLAKPFDEVQFKAAVEKALS